MRDLGIDRDFIVSADRGPESDLDQEMFMSAVDAEIDRIIEREGHYHVGGLFFSKLEDAAIQRQWVAEKNVRETARVRDREARERAERRSA